MAQKENSMLRTSQAVFLCPRFYSTLNLSLVQKNLTWGARSCPCSTALAEYLPLLFVAKRLSWACPCRCHLPSPRRQVMDSFRGTPPSEEKKDASWRNKHDKSSRCLIHHIITNLFSSPPLQGTNVFENSPNLGTASEAVVVHLAPAVDALAKRRLM